MMAMAAKYPVINGNSEVDYSKILMVLAKTKGTI
jgi:hypothetical protein